MYSDDDDVTVGRMPVGPDDDTDFDFVPPRQSAWTDEDTDFDFVPPRQSAWTDEDAQYIAGNIDDAADVLVGAALAEVLSEDVPDVGEGWTMEITDDEPDVERRRASVHRGDAYLASIVYPPYGSSQGEEGGSEPIQDWEIEVG